MAVETASVKLDLPAKTAALVFIVDDETMVGEIVETILNLEGFEARFFSDPQKALDAFMDAEQKPDLLLSDFVMTPMNGMELIARCKAETPRLCTILYSGNVSEDIVRQYSTKPDAFLTKPFLPKTLIALVQHLLDERQ